MLKKFSIPLLLILSFTLFSCKHKSNKSSTPASQIAKQSESDTVQMDYFFPPEIFYYSANADYLMDKFFPIGWSKDGNFAYINEPNSPGYGNYIFEITIINVISGDTLWYWHSPYDQNLVREQVWKDYYNKFKDMLNNYKIVQLKQPQLLDPYFSYQGVNYQVKLFTTYKEAYGFGYQVIRHTKIILTSDKYGQKTVFDKDIPEKQLIISEKVGGVMISPYGDKIIIILSQERPGYEGPPNYVTYKIIGTNLDSGWNNKSL